MTGGNDSGDATARSEFPWSAGFVLVSMVIVLLVAHDSVLLLVASVVVGLAALVVIIRALIRT